jgi:hypothetical protein
LELAKPWTYPEIAKDAALSAGTGVVYRTCYRACAGGPFKQPVPSGNYKPIEADRGGGRKHRAYDLLKSESGFGDKIFKEVWKEIFAFCLGRTRQ